jgi:dienelactone hydrolase
MFAALLLCASMGYADSPTVKTFMSGNKSVKYEVYGQELGGPILILLHGASGPDSRFYHEQAAYFAGKGYTVLMLHYFDGSGSSAPNYENYLEWVQTLDDLIRECQKSTGWSSRRIAVLGFSLGASVALAAGSQGAQVSAIADWYGSLPDEFFEKLKGMPPLLILHGKQDEIIPMVNAQQLVRLCGIAKITCESHFYAEQNHGFVGSALKDADRRTLDFFSRMLK